MENIFRIELNIFGVFIAMIVIWMFFKQIKIKNEEDRVFIAITVVTLAELILDGIFWMIDGRAFLWGKEINEAVNFFYYLFQIIQSYLWTLYCFIHMGKKSVSRLYWQLTIPLFVGAALLLVNIKTGCVFWVDTANVYHRTWKIWGSLEAGCCLIYPIIATIMTLRQMYCGAKEKRRDGRYLLLVSAVPIISAILQMAIYGLNFIWVGMAMALLLILVEIEVKQYNEMQAIMTDQKIQLMLSQIQPHFLYNTLTVIKGLCDVSPQEAKGAIDDFALFLRGNMDALSTTAAISFEQELEHVKHYLQLEHLRFEDQLQVVYELKVKDFFLPSLTLQPLVENAVKYGIGRKKGGGTVWICTEKDDQNIYITIKDNGIGFDAASIEEIPVQNDGRSHVGLLNVKKRIEDISKGHLELYSQRDKGTSVTISIPDVSGKWKDKMML